MGYSELTTGKEIQYVTLCDYDGLVEVYRIRSDGRAVRLMNWPKWLVELDYDPEWRAYCRQLKLKDERRRRQSRKHMDRLVEKLRPAAPPAPIAPHVLANDDFVLDDPRWLLPIDDPRVEEMLNEIIIPNAA